MPADSRPSYLADDSGGSVGTHLAEYSYLGLGGIVKVDYTQPDLLYNLAHGTGNDPYDGMDRFDRVVDLLWRDYGSAADAVRIKHGYDWASNRTYREDDVAASQSPAVHQDEKYTYDGVYQLTDLDRGNLSGGSIVSKNFAQEWSLDPTGNWSTFKQDDDGDTTWDLNQSRTHNKANEISDITETAGTAWPTPVHDRAGNMTSMPRPKSLGQSYTATYDAWNRLVRITEGTDGGGSSSSSGEPATVAQYEYDGLGRRTLKRTYTDGALDETRHF